MAGTGRIVADFAALESLAARLTQLAASFAGIEALEELPAVAFGHGDLADGYETFRCAWHANRNRIFGELESAGEVVRAATATYHAAETSIAGSGVD